ncbi:hypothetical protein LOC67_22765 [Stieleria sp. JC731]|uniref:hypothetical protein n=1 Tax=Stieleria sp. JC731 TaxID=2894195 RepID=UPI001E5D34CF|nr:hypothetical protein [Stieleria sp. JC731]MCC9603382.1 hypothetical protein [Stieleria sp. JC731]
MRTIADTPPNERYLMVAERVSREAWADICQNVRDYVTTNPDSDHRNYSDADILRLIDAPIPPSSYPFVVLFAYADIPADTKWNVAFDPVNDLPIESTIAVLQFGVFWRRIAAPSLEHGHHQIAVIDFPDGLPSVITSLPIDANRQSYDHVVLCDAQDVDAIQYQREIVAEPNDATERRSRAF